MYDPAVHVYKTVLMQRLLDAVINGHRLHTAGTVKLCRAQPMADKFAELYGVARNANQRAYAKRAGRASARLYLLATEDSDELYWWLLASVGAGAVHEQERLRDAHSPRARLRTGDDYELVCRTRPRTKGCGTVWTWDDAGVYCQVAHAPDQRLSPEVTGGNQRGPSLAVPHARVLRYTLAGRQPGHPGAKGMVQKTWQPGGSDNATSARLRGAPVRLHGVAVSVVRSAHRR